MSVRYFDPPPTDIPSVFGNPFAHDPPHPLARRAAEELLREVRAEAWNLDAPGGGKMFGVLVVADARGRIGYLRAFSGMLAGAWNLPGFAPPLFDPVRRDAMWPAGQATLRAFELELRALDAAPQYLALTASLARLTTAHAEALEDLRARHRDNRARRKATRAATGAATALDQQSRGDAAERRDFDERYARDRTILEAAIAPFERRRAELARDRADESRMLMKEVHDAYVITNARGEQRPLRALFAPGEPPGGAGDCAGPKLLGDAYRQGLRPLALAEVWWGAPPLTGDRHAGTFYPSCRGKCGPILPFMLEGLDVSEPRLFGTEALGPEEPRTVFEDAWLVVVDKPCGMLSVPGRSGLLRDSVQTRLRARYPEATGPLVVHRLDLDTSGLLVAAKDLATHAAVQAQFARREIAKRYVAWLEGDVRGDGGVIELPLRVDLHDRPRQIVDEVHGKPATTEWRVRARTGGRTLVELVPHTGRTHQLRVHAAHPAGLDAPIVGDRLYARGASRAAGDDAGVAHVAPLVTARAGAPAARLLLHAAHLAFVHPHTGERIELASSLPAEMMT